MKTVKNLSNVQSNGYPYRRKRNQVTNWTSNRYSVEKHPRSWKKQTHHRTTLSVLCSIFYTLFRCVQHVVPIALRALTCFSFNRQTVSVCTRKRNTNGIVNPRRFYVTVQTSSSSLFFCSSNSFFQKRSRCYFRDPEINSGKKFDSQPIPFEG